MVTLEDICYSISDGDHNAPPKTTDINSVPFVTISNMQPEFGCFDFSSANRVPIDYYDSLADIRKPRKGDIVYSVVGSFGIPILVKTDDPFVFQRHIAILRPNNNLVLSEYLYYLMGSRAFYSWADAAAIGAAQRTITLGSLRQKQIALPSLEEQEQIVATLRPYDSLVENNRKRIKLLEEAAQRLYKEWFIDLRFPGYENTEIDPETGLPEGWVEKRIEELCLRVQSGSTPSRKNANYWNRNDCDWYKTAELEDHWLIRSDENISVDALEETNVKEFPANSILMAIYASPTLGRLGLLSESATFNQAALGFIVNDRYASKEWLFQKLHELRPIFNSIARGAGQQNISGEIVKNYEIVLPDRDLILQFTGIAEPLFEKMLAAQKQIISLTEARDRILPKLMTGEMRL